MNEIGIRKKEYKEQIYDNDVKRIINSKRHKIGIEMYGKSMSVSAASYYYNKWCKISWQRKKNQFYLKRKRERFQRKRRKENLEIKSNKMLPLMPRKQNHIIMKSLFIPQCRQLKNVDSLSYCKRKLKLLNDRQIYLNQLLGIEFEMKISWPTLNISLINKVSFIL